MVRREMERGLLFALYNNNLKQQHWGLTKVWGSIQHWGSTQHWLGDHQAGKFAFLHKYFYSKNSRRIRSKETFNEILRFQYSFCTDTLYNLGSMSKGRSLFKGRFGEIRGDSGGRKWNAYVFGWFCWLVGSFCFIASNGYSISLISVMPPIRWCWLWYSWSFHHHTCLKFRFG